MAHSRLSEMSESIPSEKFNTEQLKSIYEKIGKEGQKKIKRLPKGLTIIFTGPSGSGKTTCAKMLQRFLDSEEIFPNNTSNTKIIDVGELLRSFCLSQNHMDVLKESARATMNAGNPVDISIKGPLVFQEVESFLLKVPDGNLIFADAPLDENERRFLQMLLSNLKRPSLIIEFVVSESELQKRLAGRIGKKREDDNLESIKKRCDVYRGTTMPAVGRMVEEGFKKEVVEIEDGNSIPVAFQHLLKKLAWSQFFNKKR